MLIICRFVEFQNSTKYIYYFSVRIGALLTYTPLDERTVQLLTNHLHDFLR